MSEAVGPPIRPDRELLAEFTRIIDEHSALLRDDPAVAEAAAVLHDVDFCEYAYRRTNNPQFAWRAIHASLRTGLHLGRWLRDYLLNAAEIVGKSPAKEIPRALGLSGAGGPTAATQMETFQRRWKIAEAVLREVNRAGVNRLLAAARDGVSHPQPIVDDFFVEVAERSGVSVETVRNCYYEHTTPDPSHPRGTSMQYQGKHYFRAPTRVSRWP